jgi:hypothetical protein
MTIDNITYEETNDTPEVSFLFHENKFRISGKSYSENTFEFYQPILDSLENYFNNYDINNDNDFIFDFKLTYFNSSSSKALFDMFDLIDTFNNKHEDIFVTINWMYDMEDESSQEDGEDFQDSFESLNIILIEG